MQLIPAPIFLNNLAFRHLIRWHGEDSLMPRRIERFTECFNRREPVDVEGIQQLLLNELHAFTEGSKLGVGIVNVNFISDAFHRRLEAI